MNDICHVQRQAQDKEGEERKQNSSHEFSLLALFCSTAEAAAEGERGDQHERSAKKNVHDELID